MKNRIFISPILIPVMLFLASTSAVSLPGASGSISAIARVESQEPLASENSQESDDDEQVDSGRVYRFSNK